MNELGPRPLISATDRAGTRRVRARWNRLGEGAFGGILVAPATIVMLVFLGLPLLFGILVSFQVYNLRSPNRGDWAGLRNYEALFNDAIFWQSAGVTLQFGLIFVAFAASMSLAFALALNRRFRGSGMVRVIMLLPWAVAPIVAGLMWRSLFHGSYGLVNATLVQTGITTEYVQFFAISELALLIAALGTSWMWIPFFSLILLAALQAVPDQLYRAARMDGANAWRRFTDVTFPAIRGVFIVTLLIMVVIGLETFDLLYSMTRGGPGFATSVLNYLTYVEGFERLDLGRASALGVLIAILVMLVGGASILVVALQGRQQARSGLRGTR